MSPQELDQFNKALSLSQTGQNQEAFSILAGLSQRYPNDTNILLWMAFTAASTSLARQLIDRVTVLDPQNASLPGAQAWIDSVDPVVSQTAPAAQVSAGGGVATTSAPVYTSQFPAEPPQVEATEPPPAKPVTEPAKTKEVKPKTSIMFSTAFIIFGVVLIGLVAYFVTTTLIGDKIALQNLPVYNNATRINLTSSDRDVLDSGIKLISSMTNGAIGNFQIELYKVKRTDLGNALRYYDSEMKKMGWSTTTVNQTFGGSGTAYIKDKNKVFTVSTGISVPTFSIKPSDYAINTDEAVLTVMTMEVDLDKIKSLGR